MTRPSRNQDQLLIETARRMLPEVGATGMSLKMVADKAGVNLGMFSYYFKTKSNFIRKVLESIREQAHKEVQITIPQQATSIEKLRYFLALMGRAFRDERKLALAMYRDLLNQDRDVTAFLLSNTERQLEFLKPLVKACQKEGFIDDRISFYQITSFCMAAVKTPIVATAALERIAKDKQSLSAKVKLDLTTDEAIAERVELALRGLRPSGRKGASAGPKHQS